MEKVMANLITNLPISSFEKETLTKMIEEIASQGPSFLNREGKTTSADFLANIEHYVKLVTGYNVLKALVTYDVITIQAMYADFQVKVLLNYDIKNRKVIYGDLTYIGITSELLKEIHEFDFINGATDPADKSSIRKHIFNTRTDFSSKEAVNSLKDSNEESSVEVKTQLHVTGKKDQLEKHPDLLSLFTQPKMTLLGYIVPNMVVAKFDQEDFDLAQKLYNTLGDRKLVRFRNWLDAR
jgi:hypothetical protein